MSALPILRIVPSASLALHESNDDGRTEPLIQELHRDGVIRNPPVIAPLHPEPGRYVVLDGTNRVTAMMRMGLPDQIAQVVEYGSEQVQLSSWNHVVVHISTRDLVARLTGLPGVEMQPSEHALARRRLTAREIAGYVDLPIGQTLALQDGAEGVADLAGLLHQVVGTYAPHGKILRTQADNLAGVQGLSAPAAALIVFPRFQPSEILELVRGGGHLPAGITRHLISPRALRLNYPLSELASSLTLEEKNRRLMDWVHQKTVSQSVRYYAEATVLFDE